MIVAAYANQHHNGYADSKKTTGMMKITGYLFHAVKFMGKVLQCFFVNLKMSKTYSSPHEYKLRLADNREFRKNKR